jgi:hypothetical protein
LPAFDDPLLLRVNFYFVCARALRKLIKSISLQASFTLPDLGALSPALCEFETLRWSESIARSHPQLTHHLLRHAWDLSGKMKSTCMMTEAVVLITM